MSLGFGPLGDRAISGAVFAELADTGRGQVVYILATYFSDPRILATQGNDPRILAVKGNDPRILAVKGSDPRILATKNTDLTSAATWGGG